MADAAAAEPEAEVEAKPKKPIALIIGVAVGIVVLIAGTVVGTLLLATGNHLAANNDATIRECILATPLMIRPTRSS